MAVSSRRAGALSAAAMALGAALFGAVLTRHLSYPLLWQDEAETAVFAERILEYGYPKVHGPRNVVYEFGTNIAQGIDERLDAYIGTTWGHFYFAVPGVAWARGTADLYAKTARIRLPFALAGAAGVAACLWAVWPVFGGDRPRALRFGAAYWLCAAVSISLVLHLREARYYPLLVLEIGLWVGVQLRYAVFRSWGPLRYGVACVALLVLVFHTFFAAFFVLAGWLGLDAVWRAFRSPDAAGGGRALILDLLPLAIAGLCVAPALVYFETFQIAAEFAGRLGLTPALYLENLGRALRHFAAHEFLVPALGARVAVVTFVRGADRERADIPRRAAAWLGAFASVYALAVCANPLVYERYFVVLSPIVTLVFLLDCLTLFGWAGTPARRRIVGVSLAALVVASSGARVDATLGRLRELGRPYRGPLDHAIPWIRERYPDPASLVIATNYENHPYMYYLGSHVIVGFSRSNIVADRELEPDILIPRRRWRSTLGEIWKFRDRGGYEAVPLDIRDLHYNNIPALSRSPSSPDPHRFETARPERDEERLTLYIRPR